MSSFTSEIMKKKTTKKKKKKKKKKNIEILFSYAKLY